MVLELYFGLRLWSYSRFLRLYSVLKFYGIWLTSEACSSKERKNTMFLNISPVNFWEEKKRRQPFLPLLNRSIQENRFVPHVRPIDHLQPPKQFLWSSGAHSAHHLACSMCLPARWATKLCTFPSGGEPALMCLPPAWKLRVCFLASSNREYSIASEHRAGEKIACASQENIFWEESVAKGWGWCCHCACS